MGMFKKLSLAACAICLAPLAAKAEISVCMTIAETGPAASIGLQEKKTLPLLPTVIAGENVRYTQYDDASDPTLSVKNLRKCIEEQNADIAFGASTVPSTISAAGVAAEMKRPFISMAPVLLKPAVNHWSFQTVQPFKYLAQAVLKQMRKDGVKSLGFIGYSDGYGELWIRLMREALKDTDITMDPIEVYGRADTSVDGQILKLIAAKTDAILVIGTGASAALPNLTLEKYNFKKPIYQTSGAVSTEFLRVGGSSVEGTVLTTGPILVPDQLPESHPSREIALEFAAMYEAKYNDKNYPVFGGYLFDGYLLMKAAVPAAMAKGKPGTEEFRMALRDSLENLKDVVGVHGVYNTSKDTHAGLDERSVIRVVVENGKWKYQE